MTPPIFQDYAELERWAWKLHDELTVVRDHARADFEWSDLGSFSEVEMKRIAAMDTVIYGFEEWAR